MRNFIFIFFIFFLYCKKESSNIPGSGEPVNFSQHIQPIFDRSCAISGCHDSGTKSGGLDLTSGNSYSNLVNVPSQNYPPFLRVKPGFPDSSVLYQKIKGNPNFGDRMPLGGSPLPSEEIDLIKRWIIELSP